MLPPSFPTYAGWDKSPIADFLSVVYTVMQLGNFCLKSWLGAPWRQKDNAVLFLISITFDKSVFLILSRVPGTSSLNVSCLAGWLAGWLAG